MKSLSGLAVVMLLLMMITACKKDIMTYNTNDYVYFNTDSSVYSFVDKNDDVLKDTVLVRMNLIGKLTNMDREVNVSVESTDAVEGQDFSVLRPVILQKDSTFLSLKVVVNRSGELKDKSKFILFGIHDSEKLKMASLDTRARHKLRFSDKLEQPSWWDGFFFFPWDYSETRMRFYVKVVGSTKGPGLEADQAGYEHAVIIYMLKAATATYNEQHPNEPLSDEFGLIDWDVYWMI